MSSTSKSATNLRDSQQITQQYLDNPNSGFTLYGTPAEQMSQASNLSQTGVMTGMNMKDIGGLSTQYGQGLQERLSGDDKVAQYMKNQRNRNMANTARSMAGRGVAGGAAAASMNQAQLEADAQVASQMQGFQQSAQNDLSRWVARNQKITGEALSTGSDRGLAQEMNINAGQGITVVCTELKRQGLLPKEVWAADHNFGLSLAQNDPETLEGYHIMATPIVAGMKKSKLFTLTVSKFALPWAYHIAGYKNMVGWLVMKVGLPLCKFAYKLNQHHIKLYNR
jgi:hypothetical protein